MITDERANEAFHWLENNTANIGRTRATMERTEILRKRARKRAFIDAPDGSVAAKEAYAETHNDVVVADDAYIAAVLEFETTRAKQQLETIALDVWRTECANRRRA